MIPADVDINAYPASSWNNKDLVTNVYLWTEKKDISWSIIHAAENQYLNKDLEDSGQ